MISTSTHSQHKKGRPDFALLHIQEIQNLVKKSIWNNNTHIYGTMCLCYERIFLFPQLQTIAEIMDFKSRNVSADCIKIFIMVVRT